MDDLKKLIGYCNLPLVSGALLNVEGIEVVFSFFQFFFNFMAICFE